MNIRARVILLGAAAVALSLAFSLVLELLISSRESERIARQEFTQGTMELAPAVDALWGAPQGARLLHALFARLPQGEEVYLLDPSGRILASSRPQTEGGTAIPFPLPRDAAALLGSSAGPQVRTVPAPGGPLTELFVHFRSGRALLAVRSPQLRAGLEKELFTRSLPLLALSLVLLAVTFWFGLQRIILTPLKLLADSSRRVLQGEDESRAIIPSSLIPGDEIGEVIRLRNSMLEKLRSSRLAAESELRQRTFQLEMANRLSDRLGRRVGYQELVQEVLHHLDTVVPWDAAAGFVVEAGQVRVWGRSRAPLAAGASAQVRDWLAAAAPGEGEVRLLRELWPKVRWSILPAQEEAQEAPALQQIGQLRSRLIVPLKGEEGLAGAMVLGCQQERAYTAPQVRLMQEVIQHGVSAVERVRRVSTARSGQIEMALDSSGIGVVLLDAGGSVSFMNRRGDEYMAELEPPSRPGEEPSAGPPALLGKLPFAEAPARPLRLTTPRSPVRHLSVRVTALPAGGHALLIQEEAARESGPEVGRS